VLPELGETNVIQTTFSEYTIRLAGRGVRIESLNDHMEYLLSCKTGYFDEVREKGYRFKHSAEFLSAVRQYAQELADKADYLSDVYYDRKIAIKGSDLRRVFNAIDKKLPLNKRLAAVRERAFYLLAKTQEAKKIELKRKADSINSNARDAAVMVRLEMQREFGGIKDEVFRMTKVELYDTYINFFKSSCCFEAGKSYGLTEDELRAISRQVIRDVGNRFIKYEDSAILIYFKCTIDELPDSTGIKHVVIDEAQDYSPLQYEIFRRLFPGSSFTILGDTNQMINPFRTSVGFDTVADVFGRTDSAVISLNKSYRSTREITEFTKAMLNAEKQIEGLNREGRLPDVIRLNESRNTKKLLADDIKRLLEAGMKSIAILCKTSEECSSLYTLLKGEIDISIVSKDDDLYRRGVSILPSYLCKGLEFDAVLVYGADEGNYHTEGDRKLLYTLCTRALHILKIYFDGILSPIISEIDENLYIKQ
jgi:DNA helicase-2/ATP-dependent DNA helicase PcrA